MDKKTRGIKAFLKGIRDTLTEDMYRFMTLTMADKESRSDEFMRGAEMGYNIGVEETIDTLNEYFEEASTSESGAEDR